MWTSVQLEFRCPKFSMHKMCLRTLGRQMHCQGRKKTGNLELKFYTLIILGFFGSFKMSCFMAWEQFEAWDYYSISSNKRPNWNQSEDIHLPNILALGLADCPQKTSTGTRKFCRKKPGKRSSLYPQLCVFCVVEKLSLSSQWETDRRLNKQSSKA